jgi:HEAT repeat protein
MSETSSSMWRNSLNQVVDGVSAERFRDDLAWLREEHGDDPDIVGSAYAYILSNWFIESAGLFAALQLPPVEVPAALAEIRETLNNLDLDTEQKHLKRGERRYYESFARLATLLFPEMGKAMEALFNCYVSGDYDPATDPNDLIAEALEIADANGDLERARRLITQAGAIALHSRPLWWRWQEEVYGPVELWLTTIVNLVDSYTSSGASPLGPLEQARVDAAHSLQTVKEKMQGIEEGKTGLPVPEPSPIDDLVEELIERGQERFTPEQLALCQTHRDEAIPALIDLASDEYLQMEDSPGDGYAPIHAVQILGELEAVEAVPTLVDIVADVDSEAVIYSAAIFALQKIGQRAVDPILTFMRYSWDAEAKVGLAEAIETSSPDERVYQALVTLWNEATWEDGKCLLAHRLAQTGGEQAIPLLEAALEDPAIDNWLDYNEVRGALIELGVEPPPPPDDLEMALDDPVHAILGEVSDPANLMGFADVIPEEWYTHPESLAHAYADIELNKLNVLFAMQAILVPPELSAPITDSLLEAVEEVTFDASTEDYPDWLRETYNHLAECAGPELLDNLAGTLCALQYYLSEDYDIADDPDQLLAAANALPLEYEEDEEDELWHLFGQAGALILHGRPFWSRWPAETDCPLSDWLKGLIELRRILESIGQIPLRFSTDMTPEELSDALREAMTGEEKPPPPAIAELLDLIVAQGQDSLSIAQRRRFIHHRAAVIPFLIRMVEDKTYWYEEGPGEGWAAILAVRALGELKASQAADALVGVIADSEPEDVIQEAALFSLIHIGRPALPVVQAYYRYGSDIETKVILAEVLGRIGRRNTDAFDLLRQVWDAVEWDQNKRTIALAFGDLRDRRAIPLLQAALQDSDTDALDLDYVRWALQQLSAPVTTLPEERSPRLKAPAPHTPRFLYDELDNPRRVKHTPWGELICPDCNQPLVLDEKEGWTHPPTKTTGHSTPQSVKRKRRKRKRR